MSMMNSPGARELRESIRQPGMAMHGLFGSGGRATPLHDAMFVAVSAVPMTGLVTLAPGLQKQ